MPIRGVVIGSAETPALRVWGGGYLLQRPCPCFYDSTGFIYYNWGFYGILQRTNQGQRGTGSDQEAIFTEQFFFLRVTWEKVFFF